MVVQRGQIRRIEGGQGIESLGRLDHSGLQVHG
jgi:hypothetical protein